MAVETVEKPATTSSASVKTTGSGRAASGRKRAFKDILVEDKLIDEKQIDQVFAEAKKLQLPVQQVVVDLGLMSKQNVLLLLSQEWLVKAVDLSELEIDPDAVKIIPESVARRQFVLPFVKEENILFVAMVDPRDFFAVEDIRLRTGFEVQPYLALPADIIDGLNKVYGKDVLSKVLATVKTSSEELTVVQDQEEKERVDITDIDVNAPEVEKIVNAIFLGALELKASDIHIEPFENRLSTRYRVDGILADAAFQPPFSYRSAIIAKLKILTQSMDITERRRPQDGRIRLNAGERPIELRVNIIPTVFGESCVMRILDRAAVKVELQKLGFLPDTLQRYKKSLEKPYGCIMVSGPTGSGKSTTLYASLNVINKPDIKILTAENPVEYNLEGVVQLNVNQEIGLDFASALRAFLRQDPDVIMVGEIRDKETATIAMEAAMTGHLVFSTIHTNDAATVVSRLSDMGVYPFLISSTMECVLAQRLVRKICQECRQEINVEPELIKAFNSYGVTDTRNLKSYRGKGCPACNNSGYKGRAGIHELLVMDDELRTHILKEIASGPIREIAVKNGMRPLFLDGLMKVAQGLTSFEEIMRVSQQ